jgi:hypothetical protein
MPEHRLTTSTRVRRVHKESNYLGAVRPRTLRDVVFYKPGEREGPPLVDTLLKQDRLYFFNRHEA